MRMLVGVWVVLLFGAGVPAAEQPQQRPNVLIVITDDQGYGDFSLHGNPYVRTPAFDRLARHGVQFDRFFVNSFCAPTRAALLTGRWPLRTGVFGVTHNKEAMRPNEVTLAEVFRDAGYRTACIGKWHNGEQFPLTPAGQGFQEFFGFTNGHWNNYFSPTLLRGTQSEATNGYISDVLTDEAMNFITRSSQKPFFCYLAYNAPHSPFQVPDSYFDRFKQKGLDDTVSAFYGMCENLDDNLGRLLKHLDSLRLTENTIVLFLTDNGGTAGVKLFNAGMRGGKTSVHEGGTRVPLVIRWPAANWQPTNVRPIVSHIDLFPTLLDLCGMTLASSSERRLDGISLRPLLEGNAQRWPARVLFTHNPIDENNKYPGAVRTERYRLVREIRGRAGGSAAVANDASATPWQLYDMQQDPGESRDLAEEHPEIVGELSGLYDQWYTDSARESLFRMPIPVGHMEHDPVELSAPQAYFDPPIHFASGPGYAHDWLTDWSDPSAKVWFDLDVVTTSRYEISVRFACADESAGSRVRISAGDQAVDVDIPAAVARVIPLPHRDETGKTRYRNQSWGLLKAGTLSLTSGRRQLVLEPLRLAGPQVMELKSVVLQRQTIESP